MLKNIYYASKPYIVDEHIMINYYLSRGNTLSRIVVKTKGKLCSVDSVSEEEYRR